MAGNSERDLPWVGPSVELVGQVLQRHVDSLRNIPGLSHIGQGFRINEQPPGNPISRERVISAYVDPKLTPEERSGLPSSIDEVNIKYTTHRPFTPIARPAYPARGE